MFLLLIVLVAILGLLLFGGLLGLHAMLIASAVVGLIWWITSVLATTRGSRRPRADD